jgi:DNA (cytosine-5)-methyltransferase 1
VTTSYVTVTDQFCGAGGSSLGATAAGAELRLALNHWKLAIETHNTNFPHADHDCTDVSACDPRRYRPTTMLITSPECTNHSLAKGKMRKWQQQMEMFGRVDIDPAEERSRATMWDVCRFAEAHHYQIVIVENVVEARWWAPFDAWLQAMHLLGYQHKIVYLNSMFAHPTPQSRDRMYVVFWKRSVPAPDLDFRPAAHCPRCGKDANAIQSWKNPKKPWGKYGQQYLYRCPACAGEVTPYYFCAANAIDWGLPAPRIGDRARPLKEKTLKRIEIGLKKFARPMLVNFVQSGSDSSRSTSVENPWPTQVANVHHAFVTPPFLMDYVHTSRGTGSEMVWTTDRPHRTMLGIHTHALVTPPFLVQTAHPQAEGEVKAYPLTDAGPTQTGRAELGVAVPPMIVPLEHGDNQARPATEPMPTQTTAQGSGVLVPPFLVELYGKSGAAPLDAAMGTQTGVPHHGLVTPPIQIDLRGTNAPREMTDPLSTVAAGGNHHGVVVPFLTSYYGTATGSAADEPVPAVTTRDRHALVLAPFIVSYYTRLAGQQAAVSDVGEALPTVPGRAVHYLAAPGETPAVEDCGFRMLQPHEIGAAMAFPQTYTVLGTQRDRVKQYGNAVTPPVMRWLVGQCLKVLGGAA